MSQTNHIKNTRSKWMCRTAGEQQQPDVLGTEHEEAEGLLACRVTPKSQTVAWGWLAYSYYREDRQCHGECHRIISL
eukprot:1464017-Amphidinium_carterae.1